MSFHTSFSDSEDYISDDVLGKQWCGILQSGQNLVLEITTRITTSRDIDHLLGATKSLTLMMNCLQNPLLHGPLDGASRISKSMELLMISPLCGTTFSSLSPAVLPATAA